MAPPPDAPNSQSGTSHSQSAVTSEDSDDSLVTPRTGPANPFERTSAHLTQPSIAEAKPTTDLETSLEGLSRNPQVGYSNSFSVAKLQKPSDRLKNVSFSSSTSVPKPSHLGSYRMHSSESRSSDVSPHGGIANRFSEEHEAGESSADENTAIMKDQSRQGYGATGAEGREATNTEVMNGSQKKKWSQSSRSKGDRASRPAGEADQTGKQGDDEKEGWWKSFVDKYGSVELENKGSVARDHLALERTFLAWLRTSLSFASIGVAITQLFRLNSSLAGSGNSGTSSISPNPSAGLLASSVNIADDDTSSPTHRLRQVGKPLGATFLGISIVILLLGFHRYFESQHYVIRGKFPASRGSILIVTFVAAALIITSLVIVVTVAPTALNS